MRQSSGGVLPHSLDHSGGGCFLCVFFASGVAEAFVCFWKRPHMLARVNSSTVPKLVSCVLDLLDTDRLPQGVGETGVVSYLSVYPSEVVALVRSSSICVVGRLDI